MWSRRCHTRYPRYPRNVRNRLWVLQVSMWWYDLIQSYRSVFYYSCMGYHRPIKEPDPCSFSFQHVCPSYQHRKLRSQCSNHNHWLLKSNLSTITADRRRILFSAAAAPLLLSPHQHPHCKLFVGPLGMLRTDFDAFSVVSTHWLILWHVLTVLSM